MIGLLKLALVAGLVLLLLPFAVPRLQDNGVTPAGCGTQPAGGVRGVAHAVGAGLRGASGDGVSAGEVRRGLLQGARTAGTAARVLRDGWRGRPAPTVPAAPAGAVGVSVATCDLDDTPSGGGGSVRVSRDGLLNGRLPESELCEVGRVARVRCGGPADSLQALMSAYRERFGRSLEVTDSYRSLAGQFACTAAKGSLCARPGTSRHGWGEALDLGGGVQRCGSPQYVWIRRHGPAFGWDSPPWARPGGSKIECWHVEYIPRGKPAGRAA